ncbi:MAG: universal stress protein [bacterium]
MLNIKKIAIPIDFSEYSQKALIYALSIAEQFKSEVHLLTVLDDRVYDDRRLAVYTLDELIKDRLKQQDEDLDAMIKEVLMPSQKKIKLKKVVKIGIPFSEIIKYAEEELIDLIIQGSHGRTGIAHLLVGSTTEKVIRKAPCPVLVVRPSEREFVTVDK